MPTKISVYGNSIAGRVRKHNEDSFNYSSKKGQEGSLFVVCDGVGGHKAGEVASHHASKKFIEYFFKSTQKDIIKRLKQSAQRINKEIYDVASKDSSKKGMGTTLVAAFLFRDKVFIANVGDSRAYLIRQGILKKLTIDHSIVENMVRKGTISPFEARNHSRKNEITRCIGNDSEVKVDTFSFQLTEGDQIILCTDGLWDELDDFEITDIINLSANIQDAVKKLIQSANSKGGRDNITCLGFSYGKTRALTTAGSGRKSFAMAGMVILSTILALGLITESIFFIKTKNDLNNLMENTAKTDTQSIGEEKQDGEEGFFENKEDEDTNAFEILDKNQVTEDENGKKDTSPEVEIDKQSILELYQIENLLLPGDGLYKIVTTPKGSIILLIGQDEDRKLLYCEQGDVENNGFIELSFDKELGIENISDVFIFINKDFEEKYLIWASTEKGELFSLPFNPRKVKNYDPDSRTAVISENELEYQERIVEDAENIFFISHRNDLYYWFNVDTEIICKKLTIIPEQEPIRTETISFELSGHILDIAESKEAVYLKIQNISDLKEIVCFSQENNEFIEKGRKQLEDNFIEMQSSLSEEKDGVYVLNGKEQILQKITWVEGEIKILDEYEFNINDKDKNSDIVDFAISNNVLYIFLSNNRIYKSEIYK